MADPLLTSLCTICHIQEPKYRCPRCGTRTCSLACVKKHKNWSSCNGERDPTVYVPPQKLKTDAGIDHDYNFLAKIERSVERAERILREDRGVLPQEDSHPPPNKRARLHKGRSRGRITLETNSRKWDRNSLHRMRELGINVTSVPLGMTRSKENKTSWNKRTRTINWQVEWFDWTATNQSRERSANPAPTRILHKLLDETPLFVGFAESQEYHRQQQLGDKERALEKKTLRKQQGLAKSGQDMTSTAWQPQPCQMQNPLNTAWCDLTIGGVLQNGTPRDKYRFFFQKPRTPSREPHKLIPLETEENLVTFLPGLDVVEFPTIHVFPAGVDPPPDRYVIEKRPGGRQSQKKRKGSALVEYDSNAEGSSNGEEDDGLAEQDSENGGASADDDDDDDATSSSGSDSSDAESKSDLEMS
ncbi:hypothetical protein F5X96DRAFT_616111 [Biscogniauxia mediterranea]|nr:hypothetical protein F5X96DRAFT_616111 [Biscogniauxia mediterranea]